MIHKIDRIRNLLYRPLIFWLECPLDYRLNMFRQFLRALCGRIEYLCAVIAIIRISILMDTTQSGAALSLNSIKSIF